MRGMQLTGENRSGLKENDLMEQAVKRIRG
jgi:hypothetical protein